jgi:hypothetical protein
LSHHHTCRSSQLEWVGDAALRMLVSHVFCERYSDEYPVALRGRLDVYLQNSLLGKFCREKGYAAGPNGFERLLGALIDKDFNRCKRLVEELIDFAAHTNAEKQFRAKMVRLNESRCDVRPVPCYCGSMNLNIWKRPPKVVCRNCKREFLPSTPVKNSTEMIEAWNESRRSQMLAATADRYCG